MCTGLWKLLSLVALTGACFRHTEGALCTMACGGVLLLCRAASTRCAGGGVTITTHSSTSSTSGDVEVKSSDCVATSGSVSVASGSVTSTAASIVVAGSSFMRGSESSISAERRVFVRRWRERDGP